MITSELLNPEQAAKELKLSLSRVHKLCQKGVLGQRFGKKVWAITRTEVEQYKLQPRRKPGRPPGSLNRPK